MTVISTWTDDRTAELRRLYAEGFSCSQIAFKLGEATRNSVVGKVFRLKLVSPNKGDKVRSVKAPKAPRAPREHKTKAVRHTHNSNAMRIVRFMSEPYKLRCVEIECNTAWSDVTGCWYPAGDGPFLFCNGKRADGSSYCIPHKALCDGDGTSSERAADRGIAA